MLKSFLEIVPTKLNKLGFPLTCGEAEWLFKQCSDVVDFRLDLGQESLKLGAGFIVQLLRTRVPYAAWCFLGFVF